MDQFMNFWDGIKKYCDQRNIIRDHPKLQVAYEQWAKRAQMVKESAGSGGAPVKLLHGC